MLSICKHTVLTGADQFDFDSDSMLYFYSQVQEEFDLLEFNKMCWTLCYKKNICTKKLLISDDDAFKVWCMFNFLSEDKYPLVIIIEEVRKIPTVAFFFFLFFLLQSKTFEQRGGNF